MTRAVGNFDPSEAEIAISDRHNTVAHHGNFMVQVRHGKMTPRALDRIESTVRLLRAAIKGPVGAILVMEQSARMASGDMRARQRRVIGDLLGDGRTHAVVVIEGAGVAAKMMRTVARTLLPSHQRVSVTADVASGAKWLGSRIGRSPDKLEAVVAHVRGLARGSS